MWLAIAYLRRKAALPGGHRSADSALAQRLDEVSATESRQCPKWIMASVLRVFLGLSRQGEGMSEISDEEREFDLVAPPEGGPDLETMGVAIGALKDYGRNVRHVS